jgi:hypothetical protein
VVEKRDDLRKPIVEISLERVVVDLVILVRHAELAPRKVLVIDGEHAQKLVIDCR